MERASVESSNISSIGYDEEKEILEVEFNSGAVYQYTNVPKDTYDGLITSGSHGKYFIAYIRDSFAYTKL